MSTQNKTANNVVTMFAFVLYTCSSGRVVPPRAARRSPTDEIKK